jgi:hypothetical protein
MKGACLAVLFALTATLGSAAARGPERVAIHVPAMLLPPAKLKARITVEPDADLRVLAVVAESVEGYYRRSDVPLRGLDGPKTTWIDWRDLPAGHYVIAAYAADATHIVASATARFRVLCSGGEDGPACGDDGQ